KLDGIKAPEARFLGAELRHARFSKAKLRYAKLVGARGEFEDCDLFGAAMPDAAGMEPMISHASPAFCVVFGPDDVLASGHSDGTIRLWDVSSGAELRAFRGHENLVRSVAFSPDGQRLASASDDHTVRLWDATSGAELLILHGHSDWVNCVAFSP